MKVDRNSQKFTRNVAKRTRRAGRAYVICSIKNGGREVRLESRLEQSIARALELDPRVTSYRSQPFTVELSTGALLTEKPSRKPKDAQYYTPDFEVTLPHLDVIVEVKHSKWVAQHTDLFSRVHSVLKQHGKRFIVVTEDSMPGHLERNIEMFSPYISQVREQLLNWAEVLTGSSPDALRGHVHTLPRGGQPLNYIVAAGVLLGLIKFDLRADLFEHLDFEIEPAFGCLDAFEVIDFGE